MKLIEALDHFGSTSSNYGSLAATLLAAMIIFVFKEYVKKPKDFSGTFFIKPQQQIANTILTST